MCEPTLVANTFNIVRKFHVKPCMDENQDEVDKNTKMETANLASMFSFEVTIMTSFWRRMPLDECRVVGTKKLQKRLNQT